MKKIFLLALLLGLTGCGNDNQNGASQADISPGLGGQTVAKTMSASALSLGGWSVTNTSALGASTVLDAAKDTRISAALITPNATEVAKILRGGAAGIALSLAVDQILGAVDWVLDPANNRIVYRNNPSSCELDHTCLPPNVIDYYYFNDYDANSNLIQRQYSTALEACNGIRNRWGGLPVIRTDLDWDNSGPLHKCVVYGDGSYQYIVRAAVNADHQTLSLDVVAEQVIDNAHDDDLDAQVATNAAAQAILAEAYNDAVKAQPIVNQFENNANNNCKKHDFKMDSEASYVSLRYDELYEDRYDLYNKAYDLDRPLRVNGQNKGSWLGHIQRYQSAKVDLGSAITKAGNDQCPPTPRAIRWINKSPPPQPHVHSPG